MTVNLQLPWLRFLHAFSSVLRQMPGYNWQRRGTARTLLNYLCRSMYCLCVNVYCSAATGCQNNCINPLTPKDPYSGRTAQLTSKRFILYIYSTYIGTEYFKHFITLRFFSSKCILFQNSNVFVSCIIHILHTGVLKLKKK